MFIDVFTGNEHTRLSLEEKIKSSGLSHAVLIFGKEGYGANFFARLLAADIINCKKEDFHLIENLAHPQVQIVRGGGASGQIKVESVRQINENVNFSSISGEKRVIIIENCQKLNQSSANALLKNIEEPKDDITYILTCTDPSKVLSTIRSRCGVYTLSCPDKQSCIQYFKNQDTNTVKILTDVYCGNIGLVKNALENPKRMEILNKAINFNTLLKEKQEYLLETEMFYFNKKKDELICFFKDLEYIFSNNLNRFNIVGLDCITDCINALEKNANPALVWENFIIQAKNNNLQESL